MGFKVVVARVKTKLLLHLRVRAYSGLKTNSSWVRVGCCYCCRDLPSWLQLLSPRPSRLLLLLTNIA